jgi:hypothetical protein
MFVPFTSLPSSSRIWIFQANRPFTTEERQLAEARLRQFTEDWAVHGSPLDTSFDIRYDQFIILAADESQMSASGCSIDSSVRVMKEIAEQLQIDLFDRTQVAFLIAGRVQLMPVGNLKEKFSDGTLNRDTLAFNNLISSKATFEESWLSPAANTWLSRYLPREFEKVK